MGSGEESLDLAAPPWSTLLDPPRLCPSWLPPAGRSGAALTCRGSTTSATQIMTTTSSWDGQILGVTSP